MGSVPWVSGMSLVDGPRASPILAGERVGPAFGIQHFEFTCSVIQDSDGFSPTQRRNGERRRQLVEEGVVSHIFVVCVVLV